MIVVVEWFEDDSIWDAFPITILICIAFPGFISYAFLSQYLQSHSCLAQLIIFFLCLIGFGSSISTILTWNDVNGENLRDYQFIRMVEIFIESAPAGALQIYIFIKEGTYNFNVNTISIIGSILSLCVGIEEAIGKHLPLHDRIIFSIFSLSDFLFRTVSMSFFMPKPLVSMSN